MEKLADLHVHTTLSDGTFSPSKVVEYAKEKGLSAIAITDHDSCRGIEPAIKRAQELGIEVIPGVEMSSELDDGEELHILGYFVDYKNKAFIKKLDEISKVREERAKKILYKLKKHGVEISEDELMESSNRGSVGRLHIAHLLFKKGYVNTVGMAFRDYIGNNGPCYVKKFKLTPKETIELIKHYGGVSVLAHPGIINTKDRSLEDIVSLLAADGIQGIEAYHSDHNKDNESRFKDIAEKNNLLLTGGSDCHGLAKRDILIGKVKIPYELVEKLKKSASI